MTGCSVDDDIGDDEIKFYQKENIENILAKPFLYNGKKLHLSNIKFDDFLINEKNNNIRLLYEGRLTNVIIEANENNKKERDLLIHEFAKISQGAEILGKYTYKAEASISTEIFYVHQLSTKNYTLIFNK